MNKASNSNLTRKKFVILYWTSFRFTYAKFQPNERREKKEENLKGKIKEDEHTTNVCWCSVIGKVLPLARRYVGCGLWFWVLGIHMCGSKCLYFSFHQLNLLAAFFVRFSDAFRLKIPIYKYNNMISIHLS